MKKIIFIFLIFIIACEPYPTKTPLNIVKDTHTFFTDFSLYSKKGFLFTIHEYKEPYDPVGLVEFSIKSGVKTIKAKYDWLEDTLIYDYGTPAEVVDRAYKTAISMGADAICNFNIRFDYEKIYRGQKEITLPIVNVSGFAIKRIKK